MRNKFSDQSLDAIAEVITGGSANDPRPSIGIYRKGWQIEAMMRSLGHEIDTSSNSRVGSVKNLLVDVRDFSFDEDDAATKLKAIIERSADPRDFIEEPERQLAVVEYLNKFLAFDDLKLEIIGHRVELRQMSMTAPVVPVIAQTLKDMSLDTVQLDLERALRSAEHDPEDAVTAACSIIESVCRTILVESGPGLPDKQDIMGLYKAVRDLLGLSPSKDGIPDPIAADVRNVLSGLNTAVSGIGALRTHGGDAHGRERGFKRIDTRIAKLAINSASAVALFLVETWEMKSRTKRPKEAMPS